MCNRCCGCLSKLVLGSETTGLGVSEGLAKKTRHWPELEAERLKSRIGVTRFALLYHLHSHSDTRCCVSSQL